MNASRAFFPSQRAAGRGYFSAHNPVVVLDDRGRVGQVYSAEAVFARDGVGSGIRKLRGARRRRSAGGEEPRAAGRGFPMLRRNLRNPAAFPLSSWRFPRAARRRRPSERFVLPPFCARGNFRGGFPRLCAAPRKALFQRSNTPAATPTPARGDRRRAGWPQP